MPDQQRSTAGVAFGLAAYLWWGLCPIYFKSVAHVPPAEVLAHRIVWSLILLLLLMWRRGRLAELMQAARQPRVLVALSVSTVLVALNWFVFIWAVSTGQLLQASLGYFINPLVNVLLGVVVLRERLRPWQLLSLALAVGAVVLLGVRQGAVPVISLTLAFSFSLYGLIRKLANVGATAGLTIETALLTPLALGVLVLWNTQGTLVFGHLDRATDGLLALSGVVTAVPLIWFAAGARRLRYATMGFLHYVTPTGQFLLAVLAYGEAFSQARLISFSLIWVALAIYSADAAVALRRGRPRPPVQARGS